LNFIHPPGEEELEDEGASPKAAWDSIDRIGDDNSHSHSNFSCYEIRHPTYY
jgi:hypothetical protein